MSDFVAEKPKVRLSRDGLDIEFPSLFGPGAETQARRFARRVFAIAAVQALSLHPQPGRAFVRHHVGESGRDALLAQLAAALGGADADGLDDAQLPPWEGGAVSFHRFGDIITVFEATQAGPGRLQLRHPAIRGDAALGRRLEGAALAVQGVQKATATGSTGRLWIVYQPTAVDIAQLIRVVEASLSAPRAALATVDVPPPKLGLANATLGLAALGEFAVPVVLPVCVGLLVVNNLGTIRDAGRELSQGKLGLPVLYTALLGCSITTGQIVAHALMEWSFRYWERRASATLAEECKTLLEQTLPIPVDARLVRSEQVDAQVPSASLQPGQRIRIDSPAAIPVDGRVIGGVALVEQASARGIRQAVRKAHGDEVLAGSTVLHGNLEVEVWRVGSETQAAQIAHSVIGSVRELAVNPALRRSAEAMAERAVKPTLAVAGVGWAVGGLFTVGAVLHQDYISGPKLAIPLETLRDIGAALRGGVVVRRGDALQRLAETRFVVLDDHPAWTAAGLELHSLHSRLAASETDKLLCHIAGAGLYLGDGRAQALAEACRARGLVVRQPPLLTLAADRVAVRHGEHTLILRNAADDGETAGPLRVEMDGEEIAHLAFRASAVPQVAGAVRQLRGRGAQVFVLSSRPAAEASELAQRLGANLHGGDFSADEKLRFLQGLRRRGVLAAYVGNGQIAPELAEAAHVTVSLGGASGLAEDGVADLVVLGDSLDAYAETVDLALANRERIRASCRLALAPNLLCIAGGYGGLLNGITSGLIANVGVNRVYQQAARSARDGQRLPSQKRTLV